MSTGQPFRIRTGPLSGKIVEIDRETRNTALLYFVSAVFADPSRVDKLVEVMYQPDDLNEKGLLQDNEAALFITRVVEAIKACNGDMNKARDKVVELRKQFLF